MATEVCKACADRAKTWEGDDPKCGFPGGAAFAAENWNCATVSEFRNTVYDLASSPWPFHQFDYHRHEDQHVVIVDLADTELASGPARSLWMSWYKSRGRTEAMWLLDEDQAPRTPTEADLVAILQSFGPKE